MAGLVEMNSFIGKFVNLWQSGCDASLKIESSAGKASVVLQLHLGLPALKDIFQLPVLLEMLAHGDVREELKQKK